MSQADLQDAYPLTPVQQGILSHCLRVSDPTLYHSQVTFKLRGPVQIPDLERAWQRLVQSHEVLRTLFLWEDMDQPLQAVLREAIAETDAEDWSGRSPSAIEEAWQACVAEEMSLGFDLSTAPLCRLKIRRTGPEELRLLWSYHHLILDGWSSQRLLAELLTLLAPDAEPALRRPFRDYVAWRRTLPKEPSQAYWRDELQDFSEATRLSLRSTTPADGTNATYERVRHALTEAQTAALSAFARKHRTTLPNVLSFGWAVVLGRVSRSDDVVFGVTTAGRPPALPGVNDSIGLYVNTLPVRVKLSGTRTAAAAIGMLQASAQQRAPFEHDALADVQRQSAVPMDRRLFDSILVSHSFPATFAERDGQGIEIEDLKYLEHSHFPLAVLFATEPALELQMVHRIDALHGSEVRALAHALDRVLQEIVDSDGNIEVGAIRLGHTPAPVPADAPANAAGFLVGALQDVMRQRGPHTALVDEQTRLSYADLDRRSQRLAAALEDRGTTTVGIMASGCVAVTAIISALRGGVCYVPIDPSWPRPRIEQVLGAVGADLVLGTGADPSLGLPFLDLNDVEPGQAGEPWPAVSPDAPAYVLFTSGSTGTPKPVTVSRGNLSYSNAARMAFYGEVPESYLLLSALTFDSSVAGLFWTLATGGKLVLASESARRDPDQMARLISTEGVTDLLCIPSLYGAMLELAPAGAINTLQRVIVAGEACPTSLLTRHLETCPAVALYNEYGPTEATVWATAARLTATDVAEPVVPIGQAIPGSRVWVTDKYGQPLPDGVAGELVISGPGVVDGQARALPSGDRVYATGDLAFRNDQGAFCFLGRQDRQVKVRGHRIDPAEVERSLESLSGVDAAVVLAEPATNGSGMSLAAFWEGACAADTVRDHLRQRLPAALVPRFLLPLAELPRNANGKIDPAALSGRQTATELDTEASPLSADSPELEVLAEVWATVLGVAGVQPTDDFFELGGDSIMALQVVARSRRAGLMVAPNDLFERPVLADLAEHLQVAQEEVATSALPEVEPQLLPIARWFFTLPLPDRNHWNMPVLLQLADGVSREALQRAVTAVHAAHAALRMRYAENGQLLGPSDEPLGWRTLDLEASAQTPPAAVLAEVQADLSLAAGRLLSAAWLSNGSTQWLYLAAHHLAVDAVSWQLLLEEIDRGYQALLAGQEVGTFAEPVGVGQFGGLLEAATASGRFDGSIDHWRDASALRALDAPASHIYQSLPAGNGTEGSAVNVARELDGGYSTRLHDQAHRVGGVEVLLLAAVAGAFEEVLGASGLPITLESHGRRGLTEIDLATTVGWLTASFPFLLPVLSGNLDQDLQTIRSAREAVPDGGISFGALSAAGRPGTDGFGDLPAVAFNYLGRLDAQEQLSIGRLCDAESCLQAARPSGAPRPYRLDIGAESRADGLVVSWTFSPDDVAPELVEALATALHQHLQRYVDALAAGPSNDQPALAMDEDGLDDLLAELE